MRIVYLKMGFLADLSDSGAPDAPNWRKHSLFSIDKITTVGSVTGGGSWHVLTSEAFQRPSAQRRRLRPEDDGMRCSLVQMLYFDHPSDRTAPQGTNRHCLQDLGPEWSAVLRP